MENAVVSAEYFGGGAGAGPPSPSLLSSLSSSSVESAPASSEETEEEEVTRVVSFCEGPLGLVMKRTSTGHVVVHSVLEGTQADGRLAVGERIVQLGTMDVRRLDKKEGWKQAIAYVKDAPRPLEVVVECFPQEAAPPAAAPQEAAPPAAPPPPPPPTEEKEEPSPPPPADVKEDPLLKALRRADSRARSLVDRLVWPEDVTMITRSLAVGAPLRYAGVLGLWRGSMSGGGSSLWRALGAMANATKLFEDRIALFFATGLLVIASSDTTGASKQLEVEWCVVVVKVSRVVVNEEEARDDGAFEVHTADGTTLVLRAKSKAECAAWLCVLGTAALKGCSKEQGGVEQHSVLLGTVLSTAATCEQEDELLFPDVDVDQQRDSGGRSALHLAAGRGASACVSALLNVGASAWTLDSRRRTPVHAAAEGWHDATLAVLLGAASLAYNDEDDNPLETMDLARQTPVHAAVSKSLNDHTDMERFSRTLQVLRSFGANFESRDGRGLTCALRLAQARRHGELETVLNAGGRANAVIIAGKRGATALHLAFAADYARDDDFDEVEEEDADAASRLALTCDALTRHGCRATQRDSKGEYGPEVALREAARCTPGLAAAVTSLCATALAAEEEAESEAFRAQCEVLVKERVVKGGGRRRKKPEGDDEEYDASWTALLESLERLKPAVMARSSSTEKKQSVVGWFQKKLGGGGSSLQTTKKEDESAARSALFGAQPPVDPSRTAQTAAKAAAAAPDMEEIRDAMLQRGEKLSRLSDKADEMSNASEEFEKMCKQLNKASSNRNSWF